MNLAISGHRLPGLPLAPQLTPKAFQGPSVTTPTAFKQIGKELKAESQVRAQVPLAKCGAGDLTLVAGAKSIKNMLSSILGKQLRQNIQALKNRMMPAKEEQKLNPALLKTTLMDPKKGDANIHFLGGCSLSMNLAGEINTEGRSMQRGGHYLLENNLITTPTGQQIHVGLAELNNLAKEWTDAGGLNGKFLDANNVEKTNLSFNDFVNFKMENDEGLKKAVLSNKVHYFNDEDRKNTQISYAEGRLLQCGLKDSQKEPVPLKGGQYAFALGKDNLFMALKESSEKGRIQHSSFLKGEKVNSAGFIVVGDDGKIKSVRNQSGHYTPTGKEMAAILMQLKKNLPPEDFQKIHLSLNVNTGWRIGVANFAKHHLDINWGIVEKPGHIWLENYLKKHPL